MLKRNNKGFTLVELLIVVVIMGILVGVGLPMLINAIPQVMQRKYKADARIMYSNVKLFFEGRLPGSQNTQLNPFSNTEEVFTGSAFRITENHWVCGSYNPNTDSWEGEVIRSGESYIYKDGSTEIECTPGEYFLRCIYGYGADVPASDVKFETYSNKSKLYITFEEKEVLSASEKNEVNRVRDTFPDYVAKNNLAHPVGIISIKSSDPLTRTQEEKNQGVDHVYYTYEVGTWAPEGA